MGTKQDGARIARTRYEPGTVCGPYITLPEGTRGGLSDDGNDELHLSAACEHRGTRPVVVWCPPSQVDEWFSA